MPVPDDLAARFAALSGRPLHRPVIPVGGRPQATSDSTSHAGSSSVAADAPGRKAALADSLRGLRLADADKSQPLNHIENDKKTGEERKSLGPDVGEDSSSKNPDDSGLDYDAPDTDPRQDQILMELFSNVDPQTAAWIQRSSPSDDQSIPSHSSASPDLLSLHDSNSETNDADLAALSAQLADLAFSSSSPAHSLPPSAPQTHPSLPSAPLTLPSSLSLPSVPVSSPLPSVPRSQPSGQKRNASLAGENWCAVCLNDGTLRCIDCPSGEDVYCLACWRAMHMDPDEADHRVVTFAKFVQRRALAG